MTPALREEQHWLSYRVLVKRRLTFAAAVNCQECRIWMGTYYDKRIWTYPPLPYP